MVMKKALILLPFILYYSLSYGQSNWYVGPSASTGMFWLYNKDDYKGTPYLDGVFISDNNDFLSIRNFELGLKFGRQINHRWGIESQYNYHRYVQKYALLNLPYIREYTNTSTLKYISFSAAPYLNLTNEQSEIRVFISTGATYFYLIDYTNKYVVVSQYSHDRTYISEGYEYGNGTLINYYMDTIFSKGTHTGRYNRNLFGINSTVGSVISLSETMNLMIDLCLRYVISNSDNLSAKQRADATNYTDLWFPSSFKHPITLPRSKSHNIYCGLGLSLVYKFGDKY